MDIIDPPQFLRDPNSFLRFAEPLRSLDISAIRSDEAGRTAALRKLWEEAAEAAEAAGF